MAIRLRSDEIDGTPCSNKYLFTVGLKSFHLTQTYSFLSSNFFPLITQKQNIYSDVCLVAKKTVGLVKRATEEKLRSFCNGYLL